MQTSAWIQPRASTQEYLISIIRAASRDSIFTDRSPPPYAAHSCHIPTCTAGKPSLPPALQNRCSLGIPKIKIDFVFFLKKFLKVHERVRSVREIHAKEIEGKAREVRSALGSLLALRVYPPEGIGMCAAHREPRSVSAAPNAQLSTAARRK